MIDAGAAVQTRLTVALIYLQLTETSSVAGLTPATVVVSAVNTRPVHTDHANTVVWVYLAASTLVPWRNITVSIQLSSS